MDFRSFVRRVSGKLFGIQHPRLFVREQWEKLVCFLNLPFLNDPVLYSDLTDCILRIRISNRCNCKCKWCVLRCSATPDVDMDPKWINEYCKPLYEKAKVICFTHGEFLMAPGAYELHKSIAENYPRATIQTESNGIGFNEKWRNLAADNLFFTSFSLNSVSEEVFLKGVWEPGCSGWENAFRASRKNVKDYIQLLEERGLLAFAPCVNMVISSETAHEAVDFIRMALRMKAGRITFFLEAGEFPSHTQKITNEKVHNTLIEIEKITRLLKDKFVILYDMYIPWGEEEIVKETVSQYPEAAIAEEYADILELAQGRSAVREHEERQAVLKARGRKTFTLEEEIRLAATAFCIHGKKICKMAWKEIDLSPNGNIQFCGWQNTSIAKMQDYLKNDSVDWDKMFNSPKIRYIRKQMLKGNFFTCMKCCPAIPMELRKK